MKFLNDEYYVERNNHRYKIHSTESFIIRKWDPSNSFRTRYKVQNNTQVKGKTES